MKIFVASDIHGSSYYCKKMLEAYEKEKADRLLLLGDLLYHGPRNDLPEGYNPKEVISLLNAHKEDITSVRGNCDAEVDQMVLQFPILSDYLYIFMENYSVFVTHGHIYNKDHLPLLHKNDFFLQGHTHVPCKEFIDGHYFLNPGSVSIPKNSSYHGYLLLEDHLITYKDLDGNIKDTLTI